MLKRFMQKLAKNQRGITGIETAIILIAFVVVASVFAYSVLSAGVFSSEKGKEAIFEGLDTARSSLQLVGAVVAEDTDGDADVDQIVFTVANALKGEPIALHITTDVDSDGILYDEAVVNHTTIISYLDSTTRADDIAWTKIEVGRGDGDDLLEPGEKMTITIYLERSGQDIDLDEFDKFKIEMKPDKGASLIFERTLPGVIDPVMILN